MAKIADEAFAKHQHVVIEAGTGTGKTLAYLIPAIRSGRRVVVSTATKSLQEQLFQKDVPFLQKHFAPNLKAALMKGRANFLCRQKVNQMEGQPVLKGIDEIDWFSQISDWAKLTETGDRSELTFLPDDAELWNRIDARSDLCSGQKCPEFQRCFITTMHQRAEEADLIIVNHALFFADLAMRQDDFGSILPEYAAVVFDEAHEIEDVASDYFGRQISSYRFEELGRDAESTSARAADRRGAAAETTDADARAGAELFREVSGARRALSVWPGGTARVSGPESRGVRRSGVGGEASGGGAFGADSEAGRSDRRWRGGRRKCGASWRSCSKAKRKATSIGTSGAGAAFFWRRRRST